MVKKEITAKEIKNRSKYILLGFFLVYLISPVRDWVNDTLGINPILFGIIGILAVFYYFDF